MAVLVLITSNQFVARLNQQQNKRDRYGAVSRSMWLYVVPPRAVEGYLTTTTGRVSLMPLLAGGVVARVR